MVIIIAVLLLCLLIWLIFFIKDLVFRLVLKRANSESKISASLCQNFILRFFYEFFFEFCICVFLQLSVKDFSESSPTLQFWLSVLITMVIVALIAFVASLFCWNGPWISNYYSKGTSSVSIWQIRDCNPSFDSAHYLKQHPIPKI